MSQKFSTWLHNRWQISGSQVFHAKYRESTLDKGALLWRRGKPHSFGQEWKYIRSSHDWKWNGRTDFNWQIDSWINWIIPLRTKPILASPFFVQSGWWWDPWDLIRFISRILHQTLSLLSQTTPPSTLMFLKRYFSKKTLCVPNHLKKKRHLGNVFYKIQYLHHFLIKSQSFETNEIDKNVILGVETSSWLIRANPINF